MEEVAEWAKYGPCWGACGHSSTTSHQILYTRKDHEPVRLGITLNRLRSRAVVGFNGLLTDTGADRP